MPEYQRRCSECGGSLHGKSPKAKTCDDKCRAKRMRRKAKGRRNQKEASSIANSLPPEQQAIKEAMDKNSGDLANEVIKEELRPIVREALTEDVLQSIKQLVGLTSEAIEAIQQDLTSHDEKIRQKAYELVLKFTVGNQAVAPRDIADDKNVIVNFNMPRPTDEPDGENETEDILDTRQCNICGVSKLIDEFVDNSERCFACHENLQLKAQSLTNAD